MKRGVRMRQRGAVLILMMVALIMTALTVFAAVINNPNIAMRKRDDTREGLQTAKAQLLAYAMTFSDNFSTAPNGPGRLPCPDIDNDGAMNCVGSSATLGRLPQKEVLLPSGSPYPFSDTNSGIGEQFWYALPSGYLQDSVLLNSTTATTLTFDGTADIVAVLMAPGEALTGQTRVSVANQSNAANYLENGNQTGPAFVSNNPVSPTLFNDLATTITRSELMSLATVRVVQEFKRVLEAIDYPDSKALFTAEMSASVTAAAWVVANQWHSSALENYTETSPNTAKIEFFNCAIDFGITKGVSGITRSQTTC